MVVRYCSMLSHYMKPYGRPALWLSELMVFRTYGCPEKMKNLWFDLMIVRVDDFLVNGCMLTPLKGVSVCPSGTGLGHVHFLNSH